MHQLLQNVSDLPAAARSAVEGLMGHALRDDQQVYIAALDATSEPSAEQRQRSWNDLQAMMQEMHAQVSQSAMPADALERVIDQECNEIRYAK
jgi:hypothetical protein